MLRFKVKLTTITYVHIGSGEEYYPTEYFVDKVNSQLIVINENCLIKKIESAGELDNFINISSNFTTSNVSLLEFIERFGRECGRYKVKLSSEVIYNYTDPKSAFSNSISRFIRNSLDDRPYIPGSTIKGAIRGALIDGFIRRLLKENKYENDTEDNRRKVLNKVGVQCISKRISGTEAFLRESFPKIGNPTIDIMKYLKVSDFYPDDKNKDTSLIKAYNVSKVLNTNNVEERIVNQVYDNLECIEPSYNFTGSIEIDERFQRSLNKIAKKVGVKFFEEEKFYEEFVKILNNISFDFFRWEKSEFGYGKKIPNINLNTFMNENISNINDRLDEFEIDIKSVKHNEFYLKIGKHTGAVSKTIKGCRQIKVKGFSTPQTSQTTLWIAGGYPMGWIKGEIIDADN